MSESPRLHGPDDAVGRSRTASGRLDVTRARALAATLDLDPVSIRSGDPLPFGWHWIYFNATTRRSELAEDGHERRGAFLPAIDLPRRMWAGGRLRFISPPRLDAVVQRTSEIKSLEHKTGRSGPLAFVTIQHRIHEGDRVLIEERQDLVYLGHRQAATAPLGVTGGQPRWSETRMMDEVTLFRFSALTFNGHRIHYDVPYATGVEGYPGLVVHGPLLALLLLEAGLRRDARGPDNLGGMPVTFEYRARQPIYCGESFALQGTEAVTPGGPRGRAGTEFALLVGHPERGTAMTAILTLG